MEAAAGDAGDERRTVDVGEWETFFADDRNRLT
jgi:hypothetical protein